MGKNNLECGGDGGGVHFWPPQCGTLALWPDRPRILIGVGVTGAQTKRWDFASQGHGVCSCWFDPGAEKTNSILK